MEKKSENQDPLQLYRENGNAITSQTIATSHKLGVVTILTQYVPGF